MAHRPLPTRTFHALYRLCLDTVASVTTPHQPPLSVINLAVPRGAGTTFALSQFMSRASSPRYRFEATSDGREVTPVRPRVQVHHVRAMDTDPATLYSMTKFTDIPTLLLLDDHAHDQATKDRHAHVMELLSNLYHRHSTPVAALVVNGPPASLPDVAVGHVRVPVSPFPEVFNLVSMVGLMGVRTSMPSPYLPPTHVAAAGSFMPTLFDGKEWEAPWPEHSLAHRAHDAVLRVFRDAPAPIHMQTAMVWCPVPAADIQAAIYNVCAEHNDLVSKALLPYKTQALYDTLVHSGALVETVQVGGMEEAARKSNKTEGVEYCTQSVSNEGSTDANKREKFVYPRTVEECRELNN